MADPTMQRVPRLDEIVAASRSRSRTFAFAVIGLLSAVVAVSIIVGVVGGGGGGPGRPGAPAYRPRATRSGRPLT
ncbi:hypothetical protein ND748_16010, partial [Frankia sp. AiPs1]